MQDKYTIATEDSGEYIIYISFIYGSDNKYYEGIQHIKMYKGEEVLEEFGKVPDLNWAEWDRYFFSVIDIDSFRSRI